MGNFEEAYLGHLSTLAALRSDRPPEFSIKLKLIGMCRYEIGNDIGNLVLNQIVAQLADQYKVKIDGVDLRVNVLSTGHFDDGSIAVKCSAVLAAEEEVDPDDLPVED